MNFKAIETLLQTGLSEDEIGVISPYRAQLKLIQHCLVNNQRIEVLTVDRFQGRDKECVIFSLVRSNPNKNVSDK